MLQDGLQVQLHLHAAARGGAGSGFRARGCCVVSKRSPQPAELMLCTQLCMRSCNTRAHPVPDAGASSWLRSEDGASEGLLDAMAAAAAGGGGRRQAALLLRACPGAAGRLRPS